MKPAGTVNAGNPITGLKNRLLLGEGGERRGGSNIVYRGGSGWGYADVTG